MNKLIAIASLIAATLGTAHAASSNLVVNGSFEAQSQPAGSWSVYNSLTGWSTVSGSGIEVRDNVAGKAFDGNNFVELDSNSNSAMAQTLTTNNGAAYTLSFEYSGRAGVSAASNAIEVLWNGLSLATVTADGTHLSGNDWHLFSYNVVGTGRDTLTFRATGTSDSVGGGLDAVSVITPVPEPSTYVMMGAGLALMGLSLSRRRNKR